MLCVLAEACDAEGPVRIVPTLLAAHTVAKEFAGLAWVSMCVGWLRS